MSIVLGGRRIEVAGVETISYLDEPKLVPRASDGNKRATWIRAVVVHTTAGKRGVLRPGAKPSKRAEMLARHQANTVRAVSWDATVDTDGTIAWSNDPLERYTWHASQVNPYTLGIELVQDADGAVYQATLDAAAVLIDRLTAELGIQRQTPWRDGRPYAGRIERCDPGRAGRDLVGVYGHRAVWGRNESGKPVPTRGFGDPGDHLFNLLRARGYEGFDPTEVAGHAPDDIATWRRRQRVLGFDDAGCDGVPGPKTVAALRAQGYPHGLWAQR